ncbi:MAG: DNA recombination protein RmuC [Bacteroidales bacterium]|nr:DNA recombination protein RmuC [Candidatus Latescibacterota bacterium]
MIRRLSAGGPDLEKGVRDEFRQAREEAQRAAKDLREEVSGTQKNTTETMVRSIEAIGKGQKDNLENISKRIEELTRSNEDILGKLRGTIDDKLRELQESNEKKLEQMRETVDEKLQKTLEKRLGESFKLVSERLEAVQKGLGEMKSLATGVGDLKKVLTNVKARGIWGEVQLGALLEQVLTPEQYGTNIATKKDSADRVEFAIRLPGPDEDPDECVWLPIDAKFPQEDYLRLVDASEAADPAAVQQASAALVRAVHTSAKDIRDKYLDPPNTTDFAIMFLPTEGLYAEILRQPGEVERLQNEFRIVVTGPTTLAATLSSLRMGFRTLAIEKRSSEVWKVLSAVKTEFGKFGTILDKVQKQLNAASNTIESTGARTRAMERKLREVETLPESESGALLELSDGKLDEAEETAPEE